MTNKEAWNRFGYPGREGGEWMTPKDNWKTSTQLKIIVDEAKKELHIGFQYSKGKLDWILNLIFPALPLPFITKKIGNCRVHLGMWLKLVNVESELLKLVYEYQKKKGYKIFLYGHSQGGGFAKVVHVFLRKEGYTVEKTVTWGALRVFSWFSSIAWFAKDIVSYQHRSDIVCHLPFFLMGFKGCGQKKKVGEQLWRPWHIVMPWKFYKIEYEAHTSYGNFE